MIAVPIPSTPAVSHVGSSCGLGGVGNTHRKHGVTPGTIAITRPSMLTAAPYTHGMPCFTETSFSRYRVCTLSVPSRITLNPGFRISSTLPA